MVIYHPPFRKKGRVTTAHTTRNNNKITTVMMDSAQLIDLLKVFIKNIDLSLENGHQPRHSTRFRKVPCTFFIHTGNRLNVSGICSRARKLHTITFQKEKEMKAKENNPLERERQKNRREKEREKGSVIYTLSYFNHATSFGNDRVKIS